MDETASATRKPFGPTGTQSNYLFIEMQNKFRFSPNFRSILASLRAISAKGIVPFDTFESILADNNVLLTDKEITYSSKRFCTGSTINFMRLFETLDLLSPDEVPPDKFIDNLPQPYRMIAKIIDLEIIDPAWLEITRLHPDILLNSEGNRLHNPRNFNLKNICVPSSIIETAPFSNMTSFESIDQRFIVATTSEDELLVMGSRNENEVLSSQTLFSSSDPNESAVDKSSVLSAPWISKVAATQSTDKYTLTRLAACQLVSCVDDSVADAADGKKGAAKKGKDAAPVIEPLTAKVNIAIIDIIVPKVGDICQNIITRKVQGFNLKVNGFNGQVITPNVEGTVDIDKKVDEILKAKESIAIDFGSESEIVVIAMLNSASIFYVSSYVDAALLPSPNTPRKEKETSQPAAIESSTGNGKPIFGLDATSLPLLASSSINKVVLVKKQYQPVTLPHVKHSRPQQQPTYVDLVAAALRNLAVVVLMNTAEWSMICLVPGSSPAAVPPPDKKGGKGAPELPLSTESTYTTFMLGHWKLANTISASACDDTRLFMTLGLQDGSVLLWNLQSRTLISVVGRHEAAVTHLTMTPVNTAHSPDSYIVSGANDATVCFFRLKYPTAKMSNTSTTAVASALALSNTFHTTEFVDFRSDVNNCAVITFLPIPQSTIGLVYYSNGTCACYDFSSGHLLGSFSLYIGMNARQIKSRVYTKQDIEVLRHGSSSGLAYPVVSVTSNGNDIPAPRLQKYTVDINYAAPHCYFAKSPLMTISDRTLYMAHLREGQCVVAQITLNDMLVTFCAGVGSVLEKVGSARLHGEKLYMILNQDQRERPLEAMNFIGSYVSAFMDSASISTTKHRQKSTSVFSDIGNGNGPNGGNSPTQRHRPTRRASMTASISSSVVGLGSRNQTPADAAAAAATAILTQSNLAIHSRADPLTTLVERLMGSTQTLSLSADFAATAGGGDVVPQQQPPTTAPVDSLVLDSVAVAGQAVAIARQQRDGRNIIVKKKLQELAVIADKSRVSSAMLGTLGAKTKP